MKRRVFGFKGGELTDGKNNVNMEACVGVALQRVRKERDVRVR